MIDMRPQRILLKLNEDQSDTGNEDVWIQTVEPVMWTLVCEPFYNILFRVFAITNALAVLLLLSH